MRLLFVNDPILLMRKAELGIRFLYLPLHASRVELPITHLTNEREKGEEDFSHGLEFHLAPLPETGCSRCN